MTQSMLRKEQGRKQRTSDMNKNNKRNNGVYNSDENLFPFRTEKLNALVPMVLQYNAGE